MTKKSKSKAVNKKFPPGQELRTISSHPKPIPVRKRKEMFATLLSLQEEIKLADPKVVGILLQSVTACLDDLIEIARRESSASHKFDTILTTLVAQTGNIDDGTKKRLRTAARIQTAYFFDDPDWPYERVVIAS